MNTITQDFMDWDHEKDRPAYTTLRRFYAWVGFLTLASLAAYAIGTYIGYVSVAF